MSDFFTIDSDLAAVVGSHGGVHYHRLIEVKLGIDVIGGPVDGYGWDVVYGFALHEFPTEGVVKKDFPAADFDGMRVVFHEVGIIPVTVAQIPAADVDGLVCCVVKLSLVLTAVRM